eukprot:gene11842-5172_t
MTEELYEVESILDERKTSDDKIEYLVKWKNYDHGQNSWEPSANVEHLTILLEEYKKKKENSKEEKLPTIKISLNKPIVNTSNYEQQYYHFATKGESQFLFRLPSSIASKLRGMLNSNAVKDIEIIFKDERNGTFKFDGKEYRTKLVDLPTITEAYKSIDLMTYYKAGDISQMIVVLEDQNEEIPIELDDGITPSMKNIRKTWKKQKLTTKREEIKGMVDEFMKLMSEEKDENIKIEILTDDEDEEDDERLKMKNASSSFYQTIPNSPGGFSTTSSKIRSGDEDNFSSISGEIFDDRENDFDDASSIQSDEDDFGDDQSSNISSEDEFDQSDDEVDLKEEYLKEKEILTNEISSIKHQIENQKSNLLKQPNPILKQRFEMQLQKI